MPEFRTPRDRSPGTTGGAPARSGTHWMAWHSLARGVSHPFRKWGPRSAGSPGSLPDVPRSGPGDRGSVSISHQPRATHADAWCPKDRNSVGLGAYFGDLVTKHGIGRLRAHIPRRPRHLQGKPIRLHFLAAQRPARVTAQSGNPKNDGNLRRANLDPPRRYAAPRLRGGCEVH